jgi:TM2 domain-containing membrane protein YozV
MRTDQEKYCFNCAAAIDSRASVCPKCGVPQPDVSNNRTLNPKWLVTILLAGLLGVFGVHRFYLGKIGTGILMLITAGGLGIWYLIDLIIALTGNMSDENGELIRPMIE